MRKARTGQQWEYRPMRYKPDVSDADNNSPDYALNETNRTVLESASKGTDVGRPVVVNRNEDNDTLTYQLDNNNDAEERLGNHRRCKSVLHKQGDGTDHGKWGSGLGRQPRPDEPGWEVRDLGEGDGPVR